MWIDFDFRLVLWICPFQVHNFTKESWVNIIVGHNLYLLHIYLYYNLPWVWNWIGSQWICCIMIIIILWGGMGILSSDHYQRKVLLHFVTVTLIKKKAGESFIFKLMCKGNYGIPGPLTNLWDKLIKHSLYNKFVLAFPCNKVSLLDLKLYSWVGMAQVRS